MLGHGARLEPGASILRFVLLRLCTVSSDYQDFVMCLCVPATLPSISHLRIILMSPSATSPISSGDDFPSKKYRLDRWSSVM